MLKEQFIDDGRRVRHWSDAGMVIRQVESGIEYEDAVDNVPCAYTYEETDEPIEAESSQELENESSGMRWFDCERG